LARRIARKRTAEATANYAIMGGGSPLLPETQKQAAVLERALAGRLPDAQVRCFIAMRYWKPFVADAAREVAAWAPDEIVLTPLYPQFSTTTTASSFKAWREAYTGAGRSRALCCYPDEPGFIDAYAEIIRETHESAGSPDVRLLFSAHGLPERVIKRGDPYQAQVEGTAAAILQRLGGGWDSQVCYQSRVGPLKWIGPATPDAVTAAGREGKGVLLAPIAFVSEHVETLVELDHEYAKLAQEVGCPVYLRAPTVTVHERFIGGLADAVAAMLARTGVCSHSGGRWCPAQWSKCPAAA
jgi:ferrochelatase